MPDTNTLECLICLLHSIFLVFDSVKIWLAHSSELLKSSEANSSPFILLKEVVFLDWNYLKLNNIIFQLADSVLACVIFRL